MEMILGPSTSPTAYLWATPTLRISESGSYSVANVLDTINNLGTLQPVLAQARCINIIAPVKVTLQSATFVLNQQLLIVNTGQGVARIFLDNNGTVGGSSNGYGVNAGGYVNLVWDGTNLNLQQ
jgi:hypothetical protein